MQQLTYLAPQTPISLIKQHFAANTSIHWQRLSPLAHQTVQPNSPSFAQQLAALTPYIYSDASNHPETNPSLPSLLRQPLFYIQHVKQASSTSESLEAPAVCLWIFSAKAPTQSDKDDHNESEPLQSSQDSESIFASLASLSEQHKQALLRLCPSAHFDCGSYLLSDANTAIGGLKGKRAVLSSINQTAHAHLLQALQRRVVRLVSKHNSALPSNALPLRLPLNNSVVFASVPITLQFASQNALASLINQHTDEYSVLTDYLVAMTSDALYIRASCSRLSALPLPLPISEKVVSHPPRKLLLTPFGWQVESIATVGSSVLSKDSVAALRSAFAHLINVVSPSDAWAVCTMSADNQMAQPKRFLWPTSLCLAWHNDPTYTPGNNQRLRASALQPPIPLKELASFTLKVLQEVNSEANSPYAPGDDDNLETPSPTQQEADHSPAKPDSFSATYPSFDDALEMKPASSQQDRNASSMSADNYTSDADELAWMQQIVGMSSSEPRASGVITQATSDEQQPAQVDLHSQHASQTGTQQRNQQAPTQQTQTGVKDRDAFSNLDLLTEDDFSFFDSGAFGLENANPNDYSASTAVQELFDHQSRADSAATSMPPMHSSRPTALVEDFAMSQVDQSSLDALFNTIPDVMMAPATSRLDSHMQSSIAQHALSVGMFAEPEHRVPVMHPVTAGTMSISSMTPREIGSMSFGDPASLPAFTPSSLTESSPAFGNHSLKTPRTPFSPNEDYRDNVAVLDPQARDYHAFRAQHPNADFAAQQDRDEMAYLHKKDGTNVSTALENIDSAGRLRPPIVPLPFLPLGQLDSRTPMQRSAVGNRASVGHKYDQRGKFGTRPKSIGATETAAPNGPKRLDRAERPLSSEQVRQLPLQATSGESRLSPSAAMTRKGQTLLQLRMGRHKMPSGSIAHNIRHRTMESASTPRSTDGVSGRPVRDASDSDGTSSEDEADSDGSTDADGSSSLLALHSQEQLVQSSIAAVSNGAFAPGVDFVQRTSLRDDANLSTQRPSIKQWMLSRTSSWLAENPQFRCMYGSGQMHTRPPAAASSERLEVLDALVSSLSVSEEVVPSTPSIADLTADRTTSSAGTEGDPAIRVLEPTRVAVGCQGSVLEALPSALGLWDKTNFSAVGGPKHIMAMVLLTHASAAWLDEIAAWLGRMKATFQTFELGTHEGDESTILAVADELESGLSSYLDKLIKDSDTWLDTLRSISSRIQVHLLQGKHVVLYTMQSMSSTSCHRSGFHGLLRFETDLKELLRDQVGALAEHFIARPIASSMITESASLGFGQQSQSLRNLAFSVYDQLRRLVRRQPGKILHGREAGPISASIRFPAFSLCTRSAPRSQFTMLPPEEASNALDEHLLLHIGYTCCNSGSRRMTIVSSIDERASAYAVDAWLTGNSAALMVGSIWRFALAEASKASVKWRLIITKSGIIHDSETEAWSSVFDNYCLSKPEGSINSLSLLSVRTDDTDAILADRSQQVRSAPEWTGQSSASDKTGSVLLDVSDISQMVRPTQALPLDWTCRTREQDAAASLQSRMLTHTPRKVASSGQDGWLLPTARDNKCHVLALDLVLFEPVDVTYYLSSVDLPLNDAEDDAVRSKLTDAVARNLHELRLISTERHQLPAPWAHLPWHIGVIQMLQAHLADVTVE